MASALQRVSEEAPDILHCVLLQLVDADEMQLVPFTGVARYSRVSWAWHTACAAPSLWQQAHSVLRAQAAALKRTMPDPNAPRRPRTPYQLWAEQNARDRSRDTEWDTWVAAERTLVLAWRALGAPERSRWVAAAREDQSRFQLDFERYKPWLLPGDNEDDTRLGCRRLGGYLRAERRRPNRWAPTGQTDRCRHTRAEAARTPEDEDDAWQAMMEAIAIT